MNMPNDRRREARARIQEARDTAATVLEARRRALRADLEQRMRELEEESGADEQT